MRVQIVGLQKISLEKYIKEKYPEFKITDKNPEVVLCFGGDGTLLYGEYHYPSIPKVLIRNSQICNICSNVSKDIILRQLLQKKFSIVEHIKLEGKKDNLKIVGLNDIIIGHPKVNGTLRAKLYINKQQYKQEFLGDGVVISTPLGSTAYYQSITHSNFSSGIGIAFNNTVTLVGHIVIEEDSEIEVEITRGPGICTADNGNIDISLSAGEHVLISMSKQKAQLVHFFAEFANLNMTAQTNRQPWGFCQYCRRLYID